MCRDAALPGKPKKKSSEIFRKRLNFTSRAYGKKATTSQSRAVTRLTLTSRRRTDGSHTLIVPLSKRTNILGERNGRIFSAKDDNLQYKPCSRVLRSINASPPRSGRQPV